MAFKKKEKIYQNQVSRMMEQAVFILVKKSWVKKSNG